MMPRIGKAAVALLLLAGVARAGSPYPHNVNAPSPAPSPYLPAAGVVQVQGMPAQALPGPATTAPVVLPAPGVPAVAHAAPVAGPVVYEESDGGSCGSCGRCCEKFCDWLFFRPSARGGPCKPAPYVPPLWTFFDCSEGHGCRSCNQCAYAAHAPAGVYVPHPAYAAHGVTQVVPASPAGPAAPAAPVPATANLAKVAMHTPAPAAVPVGYPTGVPLPVVMNELQPTRKNLWRWPNLLPSTRPLLWGDPKPAESGMMPAGGEVVYVVDAPAARSSVVPASASPVSVPGGMRPVSHTPAAVTQVSLVPAAPPAASSVQCYGGRCPVVVAPPAASSIRWPQPAAPLTVRPQPRLYPTPAARPSSSGGYNVTTSYLGSYLGR